MSAAALGGRDADLLRALHDQHAHALWSYVVGLTNGDRGRAQDVVQETLLRAWRNPAVLEQASGSGRSWLFTVAKRIVIDEWRSARRRPQVVTDQIPEQTVVADTAQQTVDRQQNISQLQAQIGQETGKNTLDPLALGTLYTQVESIRRNIANDLTALRTNARAVLNDMQRVKLNSLDDARKLQPLVTEATCQNLLDPPASSWFDERGVPFAVSNPASCGPLIRSGDFTGLLP